MRAGAGQRLVADARQVRAKLCDRGPFIYTYMYMCVYIYIYIHTYCYTYTRITVYHIIYVISYIWVALLV